MRKLILIKHAPPEVVPELPSEEWVLSEKGKALCAPLAGALRMHAPAVVVSSPAPKASQTAELLAAALDIPAKQADGLHEHDRSNVPHMKSRDFISMVELFFRRPRDLVLGRETARAASERFSAAVGQVLETNAQGNVAIVSHGTVIALYLAMMSEQPGFALWRQMALPSFGVVAVPGFEVVEIVARVE